MAEQEFQKVDFALFMRVSDAMECCRDNGFYDETIAQSVDDLTDDLLEKDADLGEVKRPELRNAVVAYKHAALTSQ